MWPGQAPGPAFSGDLWDNLPFCTFRGDRQLIGSWQPWKFCLEVQGQRCFSRLRWEGGGSYLTIGPAGRVRRSSAWLTRWERKEWLSRPPFFSLSCVWAVSPPPFRPLEMFKGVPRLLDSRALWPGVHTWVLRAWLSGFRTCPTIILFNQKIFKWGPKGLIFLNEKKCWRFLGGSCIVVMRMKHSENIFKL